MKICGWAREVVEPREERSDEEEGHATDELTTIIRTLVDRAPSARWHAQRPPRSSNRDMASVAYDAAKKAQRLSRAKGGMTR